MMKKTLGKVLGVVLAICLCISPLQVYADSISTFTITLNLQYGQTAARSMLNLINEFRTGDEAWYWSQDNSEKVQCTNLSDFTYDYELEKIAMLRAAEIATSFSHTRPNGMICYTAYTEAGYVYSTIGENIAAGYSTAAAAFTDWKEDDDYYSGQGHRRNMLSSEYNRIGIAHVYCNGIHYWVQEFAKSTTSNTSTTANDSETSVEIKVAESNITSVTYKSDITSISLNCGAKSDLPVLTIYPEIVDYWGNSNFRVDTDYTWVSSDSSIAVVENGVLKAINAGSTNITADVLGYTVSIPVTVTKTVVASNITSNSTSFDGKLYLNTYILLSDDVANDPDAYVSVTFNDVTTNHNVAELLAAREEGEECIKVRQEVYAAMMRDVMTVKLYNGEGELQMLTYKGTEEVTEGFEYSVIKYLEGRISGSSDPKMVELATAAKLYGIAAQVYFGYKTEQLTAEDIAAMKAAAEEITIPETYAEKTEGTLPDVISKREKTVMFQSDNALRQYFYFKDDDLSKLTFTLNDETVTPVQKESGRYYIEQPNIASGLLSKEYTFTVSDGTTTYTITLSALSYAYGRQQNSTNDNMIRLAKLLYRYSMAADVYFAQ